MRRGVGAWLAASVLGLTALALAPTPGNSDRPRTAPGPNEAPDFERHGPPPRDEPQQRTPRQPSGVTATIDCRGARLVTQQARSLLAAPARPVDARAFAEAFVDWLDPHGLWSIAPDAPMARAVRLRARELLRELEAPPDRGACPTAQALGEELGRWVTELRASFERGREGARARPLEEAMRLASLPAFDDGARPPPARELAAELGYRLGVVRASFGDPLESAVEAAVERTVPRSPPPWANVVLAAALRAYVPQLDPHGGWAPFDEETSLYEVDLEANPPPRLWRRMVRTALGVRIDEAALAPLLPGDVVVAVDDLAVAGLSLEQADQLALLDADLGVDGAKTVLVLRPGAPAPLTLEVFPPAERGGEGDAGSGGRRHYRVRYGEDEVLVVPIGDVPDDLGDEVARAIAAARGAGPVGGVVLDLRGNGGGSTDGANALLGLFLPGARLFPLHRRDGSLEVERAPVPPPGDRWAGPVAALVDGDTASAAEMIAGALAAYRRGPVVGSRTYGKGCAQEYLDDDANAGVLRLTTLLYALPDGSPVQRTGIAPTLLLATPRSPERESGLSHALGSWQGPDVRDAGFVRERPWPGHGGVVGPCDDAFVCKALRALGAPRASTARGTGRP
ncbi:MAG TPA: S41 family peptidase [Polyangiaceae bacterium]|nr:S41 family peptidase [Polyangiaceae bacterium]